MTRRARRRRNGTQSRLHGAAGLHARWPRVRPSDVPQPPDRWPSRPGAICARGYEASFGSYRVDENSHTFTFHVEGAMVRSLIGKDLPRAYEMSGNQLVVKSTNPNEHWRVAWEHY